MRIFRIVMRLTLFLALLPGGDCHAQQSSSDSNSCAVLGAEPVSLKDCVRFAVENSFDVRLAKLDYYVAETEQMYVEAVFDTFLFGDTGYTRDKREELSVFAPDDDRINEYSAGIRKTLPTGTELNLEVEDTRLWSRYPGTSYVRSNPSHTAQWTLEIVQPVGENSFGFCDRKKITMTRLAIENADLEMKDRIEGVMAETEKAYWDLVFAEKALEIYNDMLEKALKLYEADQQRFDIGLIEQVDLLNSEANVASTKAEVFVVANDRKRAEENLKLILNLDERYNIRPAEELESDFLDRNLAGCLKEAFQMRRDYREKKRDVDIKEINLRIKDNMQWPEIDLKGTMAINGISRKFKKSVGRTTLADDAYYYAGVEFTVPMENKEARSEYIKAGYEKEHALVKLKEVERTIITEVGNAFRDVIAYEESLVYMKNAVKLQTSKLDQEVKRFKQGRSGTKRIIDYMNDLLWAQLENAQFYRRHRKAKVDLDRSMNIILKKYESVL